MKKVVLRKGEQDWSGEFGNTCTLADENKQSRTNLWLEDIEEFLRSVSEHEKIIMEIAKGEK